MPSPVPASCIAPRGVPVMTDPWRQHFEMGMKDVMVECVPWLIWATGNDIRYRRSVVAGNIGCAASEVGSSESMRGVVVSEEGAVRDFYCHI